MKRIAAIFAGLALIAGCASAPRPTSLEQGDQAFAAGEKSSAEGAYARAAAEGKTPDDVFRARFFGLLAHRAANGPAEFDATLAGLRKLAADAAGNRWGRLAALYADEMGQADALRWAVQRAGADIGHAQAKVTALEAQLAEAKASNVQLSVSLDALKEERTRLQRTVQELEGQLADQTAALATLSQQLDALKKIDLSHGP